MPLPSGHYAPPLNYFTYRLGLCFLAQELNGFLEDFVLWQYGLEGHLDQTPLQRDTRIANSPPEAQRAGVTLLVHLSPPIVCSLSPSVSCHFPPLSVLSLSFSPFLFPRTESLSVALALVKLCP